MKKLRFVSDVMDQYYKMSDNLFPYTVKRKHVVTVNCIE